MPICTSHFSSVVICFDARINCRFYKYYLNAAMPCCHYLMTCPNDICSLQLLFDLAQTSSQSLTTPDNALCLFRNYYPATSLILRSLPTTSCFFFCLSFLLIFFSEPWPAQHHWRLEIEWTWHHIVVSSEPCIWPERRGAG
jgi:hypothetical protein